MFYSKYSNVFYWLIAVSISLLLFSSCEREQCTITEASRERINVGYYSVQLIDGVPTEDSLQIANRGVFTSAGTNLQPNVATLSKFSLPLPIAEDSTAFIFQWENAAGATETDTIEMTYGRNLILRSQACGFEARYDSIRIIRHTFDSIAIDKATIDSTNATNIKIYL
jgi:hypothetical protein